MKMQWKQLGIAVLLPLVVGGLATLLTKENMQMFEQLQQPPLSPPMWLFPVVWSILYVLMGIASYLVYRSNRSQNQVQTAYILYGLQLVANFVWTLLFFNLQMYWLSFAWLLLLWFLIFLTWKAFRSISELAAWLLVPYLIWVTFAAYLNFGFLVLN